MRLCSSELFCVSWSWERHYSSLFELRSLRRRVYRTIASLVLSRHPTTASSFLWNTFYSPRWSVLFYFTGFFRRNLPGAFLNLNFRPSFKNTLWNNSHSPQVPRYNHRQWESHEVHHTELHHTRYIYPQLHLQPGPVFSFWNWITLLWFTITKSTLFWQQNTTLIQCIAIAIAITLICNTILLWITTLTRAQKRDTFPALIWPRTATLAHQKTKYAFQTIAFTSRSLKNRSNSFQEFFRDFLRRFKKLREDATRVFKTDL